MPRFSNMGLEPMGLILDNAGDFQDVNTLPHVDSLRPIWTKRDLTPV